MNINIIISIIIILGVVLNIIDYNIFLLFLSIVWYIASMLIIYSAIKYSVRNRFIQFNFKKIIMALKSKSKNNISPLASLCLSLAAKIGVGSLSGVALAVYLGGIGTIFWLCLISLGVSINAYVECMLGIKYRVKCQDSNDNNDYNYTDKDKNKNRYNKINKKSNNNKNRYSKVNKKINSHNNNNNNFIGGPSFYIKKCLNNNYLSKLYSLIVIITYSVLFLSIQSNTIITTCTYYHVNKTFLIVVLAVITLLIILKGIKTISKVNTYLVPIMLMIYFLIGIYVFISNLGIMPDIFGDVIREAFNLKAIIPVFLIGMQRAIFITECSIGTSAISASSCDNDSQKQGMLEIFGVYITIFIICLTTFLIIITSDYSGNYGNTLNGIEIVLQAFKYHFGANGSLILAIITILFAFSTIISSYFFGESNLFLFTKKNSIKIFFKIIFILVIIISGYLNANILWNLTDFFVAILAIINVYSMMKITK